MIVREKAILKATAGADMREAQGCFIVVNTEGIASLCATGEDAEGVITISAEKDDEVTYVLPSFPGIVEVRVSDACVKGDRLAVSSEGCVTPGTTKVVARALEAGESGQLVQAILINQ